MCFRCPYQLVFWYMDLRGCNIFVLKMARKIISLNLVHIMLEHLVEWWHWNIGSRCITLPTNIRLVFGSYLDHEFWNFSVSLDLYIALIESWVSLEIRPRLISFAYFTISYLLRKLNPAVYKCLLQAGLKLHSFVK